MWDDVVAANEAAIRLSVPGMQAGPVTGAGCGHSVTWLAYGYLQEGRFADAQRLVEDCGTQVRERPRTATGADALDYDQTSAGSFSAMRARYLIDTGDWSGEVATMVVEVEGVVVAEYTRDFADAYGAARHGEVADAAAAVARARSSGERFLAAAAAENLPEATPIRGVPRIQRDELEGLLLLRRGDVAGGVALLSKAAAAEKAIPMEYGPPSLAKPANELLGEVLLELNRPQEARAAFEAAQVLAPGRGQSLIGLSACAAALGDRELAASVDARLAKVGLREALIRRTSVGH
jgi:hypothetical protein